jgi:HAD superfamily hydrolase (TIGR01490 family)
VRLAIFDLDNTLLNGDSDHAWGEFLCDQGLVDRQAYRDANDLFYQQYQQGTLNINEFLEFALNPLKTFPRNQLNQLHQQFMEAVIQPMMLPAADALLEKHRQAGDYLLIITATNSFITAPIAAKLGVDAILATDPEVINGEYTGKVTGTPCFREGKVERLNQWLEETGHNLKDSYFYSDSCNDLPLLEVVDHPVAVNPDAKLLEAANSRGWPVLDLRV